MIAGPLGDVHDPLTISPLVSQLVGEGVQEIERREVKICRRKLVRMGPPAIPPVGTSPMSPPADEREGRVRREFSLEDPPVEEGVRPVELLPGGVDLGRVQGAGIIPGADGRDENLPQDRTGPAARLNPRRAAGPGPGFESS